MLDTFLGERGKHIISVMVRINGQLHDCDLNRACRRVLNTVGMLDTFLRERGKHIISVMVPSI